MKTIARWGVSVASAVAMSTAVAVGPAQAAGYPNYWWQDNVTHLCLVKQLQGAAVFTATCNGSNSQEWQWQPLGNGYYRIASVLLPMGAKCLTTDGKKVWTAACGYASYPYTKAFYIYHPTATTVMYETDFGTSLESNSHGNVYMNGSNTVNRYQRWQ